MNVFNNINDADVAVLPRSRALLYSSDFNPREITEERLASGDAFYVENNYANFLHFGEYKIEPNGIDNNFPVNYKMLLDSVYLAHGVKRTLINLLISGGIGLYQEVKEEKKIIRDWLIDKEVSDWLNSFNCETEYIPELATDMVYLENAYTLFLLNKGARIGFNERIAALRYLSVEKMRLEYPDKNGNRNRVFYSDWFNNLNNPENIKPYPIFNMLVPFKNPQSVMYVKMPTFGSTAYGRPPEIGAVQMLKVLSLLPAYHRANLTEKGFKWIVSVSREYYDGICTQNRWEKASDEFKKWKDKFVESIDSFLSAPEGDKVQTRFLTEFQYDPYSKTKIDSIVITKLEDDTKELSEVGMSLHDTYTVGFTSASSINPQLANVHLKNHALSGSQLREAYEMHIKTATPMMRTLLLHPVNTALKINFPNKNIKIGFMDVAFEDYNQKKNTTPVNN